MQKHPEMQKDLGVLFSREGFILSVTTAQIFVIDVERVCVIEWIALPTGAKICENGVCWEQNGSVTLLQIIDGDEPVVSPETPQIQIQSEKQISNINSPVPHKILTPDPLPFQSFTYHPFNSFKILPNSPPIITPKIFTSLQFSIPKIVQKPKLLLPFFPFLHQETVQDQGIVAAAQAFHVLGALPDFHEITLNIDNLNYGGCSSTRDAISSFFAHHFEIVKTLIFEECGDEFLCSNFQQMIKCLFYKFVSGIEQLELQSYLEKFEYLFDDFSICYLEFKFGIEINQKPRNSVNQNEQTEFIKYMKNAQAYINELSLDDNDLKNYLLDQKSDVLYQKIGLFIRKIKDIFGQNYKLYIKKLRVSNQNQFFTSLLTTDIILKFIQKCDLAKKSNLELNFSEDSIQHLKRYLDANFYAKLENYKTSENTLLIALKNANQIQIFAPEMADLGMLIDVKSCEKYDKLEAFKKLLKSCRAQDVVECFQEEMHTKEYLTACIGCVDSSLLIERFAKVDGLLGVKEFRELMEFAI